MKAGFFITGTDTGCGKTEITLGLMRALQQRGERVQGMKPVASGAQPTAQGLRNEDALRIQAQGSSELPYDWINPFAYAPPIAPHLAARRANRPIEPESILDAFTRIAGHADRVVVEGVGGWQVPLNGAFTVADLALRLELPVILVVGLRLGCINHALLTATSIRQSGARLLGWVANQVEPGMAELKGNLETLHDRLQAPCLGEIPWFEDEMRAGIWKCLEIGAL
jgi:dethiobiotin synthetase